MGRNLNPFVFRASVVLDRAKDELKQQFHRD
jgi:hypothetical protein